MTSTHKPTGNRLGRPRKGEVRPDTPGAIYQRELRARRIEEDPDEHYARIYAAVEKNRLNNPELVKQRRREYYLRSKAWKAVQLKSEIRGFKEVKRVVKKLSK